MEAGRKSDSVLRRSRAQGIGARAARVPSPTACIIERSVAAHARDEEPIASTSTTSRSNRCRKTSSEKKFQTVKVDAWLEPGTAKTIDLDEIGTQATARVYAHAEGERLRERDSDARRGADLRRAVQPVRRRGREREGDPEGDRPRRQAVDPGHGAADFDAISRRQRPQSGPSAVLRQQLPRLRRRHK